MATQIGAQMYTLRDFCKTPDDIAKTCRKLADIGYGAVQASALVSIEPDELRRILDDNGLVCAATHVALDDMADAQSIADHHHTLGCELTAIGGFGRDTEDLASWQAFIAKYNALAGPVTAQGIRIGYHNHSHELVPFARDPAKLDPGQYPMQLLINGLDEAIWFEIDTYWIAHGGGDPADWIARVAGRIPAVHVKDMTITPEREQKMCEVGAGNLNWPRNIEACQASGVKWYLVERDDGDLDPFESLKISFENLKSWGIE